MPTPNLVYDPETNTYHLADESAPGAPLEAAPASSPFLAPGQPVPEREPLPIPQDPKQFVRDLLSAGGTALEVGAPFATAGMSIPVQLGADALAGTISGVLKGDNPVERGVENAALGGFGIGAGKIIPNTANRIAVFTGTAGKKLSSTPTDIVEALNRLRQRYRAGNAVVSGALSPQTAFQTKRVSALPFGVNPERVATARHAAGSELEQIERSIPGLISEPDWIRAIQQELDPVLKKAATSDDPLAWIQSLVDDETNFIRGHVSIRGNPAAPFQPQSLTVREAGELARAEANRGRDLIRARKEGQFTTPDAAARAQTRAEGNLARSKGLFNEQERVAGPSNTARLRDKRQEFSDLKTVEGANAVMRRGLGQASVRSGGGFGMGLLLGSLSGVPYLGPAMAGLGLMATPANISRTGYLLGDLLEALPAMTRAYRGTQEVRRREPAKKDKD